MSLIEIIALFAAGICAVFTCLSGYFMWKNGAPQISNDVITTYKSRIEQLDERVKTCETLHRENLSEVGRLKGVGEEKDKRISTLETILQGKNPEMDSFIKFVTETSKENHEILLGVKEFFDQLKTGKHAIVTTAIA